MSDRSRAGQSRSSQFSGGAAGRWLRLTRKELKETLRDRRTIITLVLMPLLLYPLLGVAFQKYLLSSVHSPGEQQFYVAVESDEALRIVKTYLQRGEAMLIVEEHYEQWRVENQEKIAKRKQAGNPPRFDDQQIDLRSETSRFHVEESSDLEKDVSSGAYDIGIRFKENVSFKQATEWYRPDNYVPIELIYSPRSPRSVNAREFAERCLAAVNDDVRINRATGRSRRVPRHDVPALVYSSLKSIEPTRSGTAFSLGALIPLILILMTVTGAVYPAIDLTAGERERGTLEMLVAAPIPRMGLLLAKYTTVVVVAALTATMNLISMALTIFATGLGTILFGEHGLSVLVVVEVFGLMILFASFFSALLLAVTSFARSFKEAQAYLIPLMLVSIAPGLFSIMPNLNLNGLLAVTPLANIVLLARDLFQGTVTPVAAITVVLSTVVYALLAILVAARIFGTDAILYGSPGTWSDLFERPEESSPACTPLAAVMALAIAFPASFLLNQLAGQWLGGDLTLRLFASGCVTVLIFAGIPVSVGYARNLQMRNALSLRSATPLAIGGAILLGLSLWPFAFELIQGAEELEIVTISKTVKQYVKELVTKLQQLPPAYLLLVLAAVPAVCEELFFRGLLLSSLRQRMQGEKAIVLTAFAFAAFHVIISSYLAIERFLPSFFLGLVLGWVCVRTGSLLPGVLLHAAHNGLLIAMTYYKDAFEQWAGLPEGQTHLPVWWLLVAAAVAGSGVLLVVAGTRSGVRQPA